MQQYYLYLVEVRARSEILLISWLTTIFITYKYKTLLFFLFFYINQSNTLISKNKSYVFTSLTEVFSTHTSISLFIANQAAIFYFIYQLFLFFCPGLYWYEYITYKKNLTIYLVIYCLFVYTFNFIIFPISWNFFFDFFNLLLNSNLPIAFDNKINHYLSYYISLYFTCYTLLNLTVLFCLSLRALLRYNNNLLQFRSIIYTFFLVIATAITPPDVFSQLFLVSFFIFFYETFLFSEIWLKYLNAEAN